ncbi:MAG: prolyl oligopeptidase family serine peptidase [Candidatus Eisenbacteria bacterium]|nr:prolyl oligopeptidase family serine peptidase [Candidatus Eisenbacteria bacterium]
MSRPAIDFTVVGSGGRPLRATLHPARKESASGIDRVILLAHGWKGFRAWGFWPFICDALAEAGLHAIRFDFSHNGVEQRDFDRLDLFAIDTPSRHQEDLGALLDFVSSKARTAEQVAGGDAPWPIVGGHCRMGLLGHSRGGADALLRAAGDSRVAAVVALAGVADFVRGLEDEATLREFGYVPIRNARTGQVMPVTRLWYDDAQHHDILAAAAALSPRPLLVIHAEGDLAVPVEEAERLASAHGAATVLRLPESGHTFGITHPWARTTPELSTAVEAAAAFFQRHL